MATIIAGRLQLQEQAEEAIHQLVQAGFAPQKIASFYVNPPGQHALYPIGGDRFQSPGIEEIDKGLDVGSNVAAVTETMIGAHKKVYKKEDSDHPHPVLLRRAGMLVAVELPDSTSCAEVTALFKRIGATHLEQAEGEIVNGEWPDFNPISEPCYIEN